MLFQVRKGFEVNLFHFASPPHCSAIALATPSNVFEAVLASWAIPRPPPLPLAKPPVFDGIQVVTGVANGDVLGMSNEVGRLMALLFMSIALYFL